METGMSGAARSDRSPRFSAGARLGVGVVLIIVAAVLLSAAQVLSEGRRHAYDLGSTPQRTYHLTQGRTYQLSTPGGVKKLTQDQVLGTGIDLSCTQSADGFVQVPIVIASTRDDSRDLYLFATFTALQTGDFQISCKGIAHVYVDDADDVPPDWAGLVVLSSCLIGLLGVAAALSGGYERSIVRSGGRHSVGQGSVQARRDAADLGVQPGDPAGDEQPGGLRFGS